jgi:hypothetical protein
VKKSDTASTGQQIRYALYLLGKKGYSTRDMDATFKSLGATREECHGSVERWLADNTVAYSSPCASRADRIEFSRISEDGRLTRVID